MDSQPIFGIGSEPATVLAPLDIGDDRLGDAAGANGGEYGGGGGMSGGMDTPTLLPTDEASDDGSFLRSPSPPTSPPYAQASPCGYAHKASRIPKASPSPTTNPASAQATPPEGASGGTPLDEHAIRLGLQRKYLVEATVQRVAAYRKYREQSGAYWKAKGLEHVH